MLDECALMAQEAWSEALRPALADRQGGRCSSRRRKAATGSGGCGRRPPRAGNGNAGVFPATITRTLHAARLTPRANLPERVFAQEFMAEFLEDGGGVFRRVMDATTAKPQDKAEPGHDYIVGVDWAKSADFTVLAVLDATAALVYLDRFNQIDYTLQAGRLHALCERFKPQAVIAERNSIEGANYRAPAA